MAKTNVKKSGETYDTPGFRVSTPVVSDKPTSVTMKEVPNSAVSVNLPGRTAAGKTALGKTLTANKKTTMSPVGGSYPVKKSSLTKGGMTPVKKTTMKPVASAKPVGNMTPVKTTRPVYETPGFKPVKKTSKK